MQIAVSGELASGKTTVGRLVASRLSLQFVSTGELHRKFAHELGLTTLQLNEHAEADRTIDDTIDSYLATLGQSTEECVVDSRLAWHFLPRAFKVHIVVDPMTAAERALSRGETAERYTSASEALDALRTRRMIEVRRFQSLYGLDISKLKNYDFVVDSSSASAAEVAEHVILAAERNGQLWHQKPHVLLDPLNLYPTESPGRDFDARVQQFRAMLGTLPPISVGYSRGRFFIIDGHARVSAAIRAGTGLIEGRLAGEGEDLVVGNISANQYFRNESTRAVVSDWDAANNVSTTASRLNLA